MRYPEARTAFPPWMKADYAKVLRVMMSGELRENTGKPVVIMRYQNPFNENMSHEEAREILFREIEKTTSRNRFVRLQADYVDVLPVILRREINAFWKDLKSKPE